MDSNPSSVLLSELIMFKIAPQKIITIVSDIYPYLETRLENQLIVGSSTCSSIINNNNNDQ